MPVSEKRSIAGRRRRRRSKSIHELRLQCEALEQRVVLSTFTWTGNGANANWSTGTNWQGGVSPSSGSILVFGTGVSQLTNTDDISGLSVAEIELSGGYSISGNSINLTGSGGVGIDNQTAANSFNNPIALAQT